MKSLNALFEEDIEMQDAIEDIDDLFDDTDDMIIGVTEDRYKDEGAHLFTEEFTKEDIELQEDVDELLDDDKYDIDLSDEDYDDLFDDDDDSIDDI